MCVAERGRQAKPDLSHLRRGRSTGSCATRSWASFPDRPTARQSRKILDDLWAGDSIDFLTLPSYERLMISGVPQGAALRRSRHKESAGPLPPPGSQPRFPWSCGRYEYCSNREPEQRRTYESMAWPFRVRGPPCVGSYLLDHPTENGGVLTGVTNCVGAHRGASGPARSLGAAPVLLYPLLRAVASRGCRKIALDENGLRHAFISLFRSCCLYQPRVSQGHNNSWPHVWYSTRRTHPRH